MPIQRFVLETSGMSKPGPLLRQLSALAEHRLRVCVIATFDPITGLAIGAFEEAAAQWAAAHRLVVTKADVISESRLEETRGEIEGLNPLAEIVIDRNRANLVEAAFRPLARHSSLKFASTSGSKPHPCIGVRLARPRPPLAYDDLATWLDNLADVRGERLLRLKGLVRIH